MKTKILVLIIGLILFCGMESIVNGEIISGEEKVEEIGQRQVNTFDPFLLILIFVILVLIFVFILIVRFASRIEGSDKPVWIGAAIGFLIGLLGFVTVGMTAYPISFLLNFFGIEGWDALSIGLILAPFVYANIGAFIGLIKKRKEKKTKGIRDDEKVSSASIWAGVIILAFGFLLRYSFSPMVIVTYVFYISVILFVILLIYFLFRKIKKKNG